MGEIPKYAHIKADICRMLKEKIAKGEIHPGDRVLSETDIIITYEVSAITAKRVLNELTVEGKIYRVQGKGSYLANWESADGRSFGKHKDIAFIAPGIAFSFFAEMAYGFENEVKNHGYGVFLCNSVAVDEERDYIHRCISRHVDAVVIVPHPDMSIKPDDWAGRRDEDAHSVLANGTLILEMASVIPTVLVDYVADGFGSGSVVSDDVLGASEAVDHLISIGRTKIAHMAGPRGVYTAACRVTGYKKSLRRAGIAIDDNLIRVSDFTQHSGYVNTKALLDEGVEFDAVFACDDKVAVGVYDAVMEHGLRVPEDIAIVGYGNETEPLLNGYAITTVDQQSESMGREAGALVMQLLSGASVAQDLVIMVPTGLLTRESTLGSRSSIRRSETEGTATGRQYAGFGRR